VEDAAEVRRDDRLPVGVGHAGEQAVAGKARVVDEDVEVTCLVDEPLCILGIGDIRLNGLGAGLGGDGLRLLLAGAIAERDRGARARKL
jgi:hypothetical protein